MSVEDVSIDKKKYNEWSRSVIRQLNVNVYNRSDLCSLYGRGVALKVVILLTQDP